MLTASVALLWCSLPVALAGRVLLTRWRAQLERDDGKQAVLKVLSLGLIVAIGFGAARWGDGEVSARDFAPLFWLPGVLTLCWMLTGMAFAPGSLYAHSATVSEFDNKNVDDYGRYESGDDDWDDGVGFPGSQFDEPGAYVDWDSGGALVREGGEMSGAWMFRDD